MLMAGSLFLSAPNLIVSAADAHPAKSNGSDQGILAVLTAFQLVIHLASPLSHSQNALCQAAECEGDKKRVFTWGETERVEKRDSLEHLFAPSTLFAR